MVNVSLNVHGIEVKLLENNKIFYIFLILKSEICPLCPSVDMPLDQGCLQIRIEYIYNTNL